ncbi:MAG: hypothetical protein JW864_04015 [Spirochaetes bacterium]|nr:hypothetical protein [Spirochaetota bacterium]
MSVNSEKIKGVWKIKEMDVGMGENQRTRVPQAFMICIMNKYFSAIRDFSEEPRKSWGETTTPEEMFGSIMGGFMADAGTYEFDGENLKFNIEVAMIPNMMQGGSMTFGLEMEGDNTLILRPQYDKMISEGMKVGPKDGKMGYGDMAVRYQFERAE